jgi:dGTPase
MPMPAVLAPYASMAGASRGRRFPEPESATRNAFQRDRDRIIHSAAFRRLQYKTQVFVYHEGDHYRTRLTHSLEVSQIARSICRMLGLDSDLAEALALAHDLGHTPFGHAGEDVLDAAMADFGGFDHNAQTLRILTRLERRYAAFDGLNLTWETLEGTVKHNGPIDRAGPVPAAILDYDAGHDLDLDSWPGLEAQAAALSDDIAYNHHDLDDGVRADLFSIEQAAEVPLVAETLAEVRRQWPGLDPARLTHEVVRRLIGLTIEDVLAESGRRIAAANPASVDAVRRLGRPLIGFSDSMREADRVLKSFLRRRMYEHGRVAERAALAARVVRGLFELYMAEPGRLPAEWRAAAKPGEAARARTVADFIAGMTDRFAIEEHRRLTGARTEL